MDKEEKESKYRIILEVMKAYSKEKETPLLTVLSHLLNYLKSSFPYMDWVGYYFKKEGKDELYLGPYIGHPGCDLIKYGKGVCGEVALTAKMKNVSDVSKLKNYIACDSSSLSEIVLPLFKNRTDLYGVLDIDSNSLSSFDRTDEKYLQEICLVLIKKDLPH